MSMQWSELAAKFIRTLDWPSGAMPIPRIQNHRGFHLEGAMENTIPAFRAAREIGGLCSELDVRLSRNLVPVVFHDDDLSRLLGRTERAEDLTDDELQSLGIPTLARVLSDTELTPYFNVELKSKIVNDSLPRRVAQVIANTRASSRIMFSSFNPACLYMIQNYCPNIPRALLASSEMSKENRWYLRHLVTAPFLKLHMLNLEDKMLTDALAQRLREEQILFSVWTVDSEIEVQRFLRMGANSVITNLKLSDQLVSH